MGGLYASDSAYFFEPLHPRSSSSYYYYQQQQHRRRARLQRKGVALCVLMCACVFGVFFAIALRSSGDRRARILEYYYDYYYFLSQHHRPPTTKQQQQSP